MPLRSWAEEAGVGKLGIKCIGQIPDDETQLLSEWAVLKKSDACSQ